MSSPDLLASMSLADLPSVRVLPDMLTETPSLIPLEPPDPPDPPDLTCLGRVWFVAISSISFHPPLCCPGLLESRIRQCPTTISTTVRALCFSPVVSTSPFPIPQRFGEKTRDKKLLVATLKFQISPPF
ncbi:uncharacterized protein LOC112084643 [Eutrema salsugineum]|uniref:uncharacterized protein LOC112084643 n=1 Tax=Eutrema salsugineum TaxID=72664 RepID=UPI000CECF45C|nr:uncharacterized protein LOC112084643 [Eutrema salsugineum]